MTPDPEKVRFWEARAAAYDRLCRRWQIFSQLSNRLIDMLPADLHGPVLDIGAGSGLTSEILLARHPRCHVMLIEPSEAMLNLARLNLTGRPAQFFAMGLDRAPVRRVHAVAALASASMHYLDLDPAFATLAQALAPGGYVAFNLWWHHWEETSDRKSMTGWQSIAEAVCLDAQLPPPPLTAPTPKAKTRTELMDASRGHGFHLLREQRDEYLTPTGFGLDFQAMDTDWPAKGLAQEARHALLTKMHELANGSIETLVSTRFLFQKRNEAR